MMIGRLVQTALISLSSGACLSQAPTFNNERTKEPNNAILTETKTITITNEDIEETLYGQEIWQYDNTSAASPQGTNYQYGGNGRNIIQKQYRYYYDDPDNYGNILINSYRYMVSYDQNNAYDEFNYYTKWLHQVVCMTLDIIEINANYEWNNINPYTYLNYYQTNSNMYVIPKISVIYQDDTRPQTQYNSPNDIMNYYINKIDIPGQAEIDANVYVYDLDQDLDYDGPYIQNAMGLGTYVENADQHEVDASITMSNSYIPRTDNENQNYCSIAVMNAFMVIPPIVQNGTRGALIDNINYDCNYDIELTKQINTQPTTPEVVDIPGIMYTVLAMPFSFITQAFNLTLFPGTQYSINIADVFLAILTFLILLFVVKMILKQGG